MEGKIIGMNTAIFSEDGKNAGVGFATPSNVVKWVVSQLKQHGKVIRGWLGVAVQNVRVKGGKNENALVISAMTENSPASAAGLKVGDKILAFGNISLKNPRLFSLDVAKLAPETVVPLQFSRDGKVFETKVTIKNAPLETKIGKEQLVSVPMRSFEELGLDKYKIGKAVDFEALGFAAYYDESTKELAITNVSANSEAEEKGIKIGDRVISAGGKPIFGIEDMRGKIKQAKNNALLLQLKDSEGAYGVSLQVKAK